MQNPNFGFGAEPGQVAANGISLKWNLEEIGFFKPGSSSEVDYEYQGKAMVWRNVYLFVNSFQFNSL